MKKFLALILAIVTVFGVLSLTSCGVKPEEDWENIKEQGYFTVGYTIFDPMNYKDADEKLIGFDTEYAQLVGEYLGVEVKFQEIAWGEKYLELDAGKIDCIWNGFTSNSEDDGVARADQVDFPTCYATNYQCVVMKSGATFTSVADLAGKKCAVEKGSAGEAYATSIGATIEAKPDSQIKAFIELAAGKVDFIVVDVLLALRTCGVGDYTDLAIKYEEKDDIELYGVGCRKGSNFDEKIEEATKHLINNGKLQALADKYNVPLSKEVLALKK